ncbi:MAG: sulfatase-like hydrolase/transferase, partial [Planctomycetia bacterium]|nr:sulfatase-like hydrolase/transferase [Planctomycetia bacterium]
SKGFHPSVQEYVAAIEQADKHVGEVVTAMRSRVDYANEQWLIIITSDHGGRGLGHSGGHQVPEIRNSFLVVSGTAAMRGRIEKETYLTDVVPTALTHLDVNLKAEWALDGQAVGLRSGL